MNKTCRDCSQQFNVEEDDLKFLARLDLKSPEICPDCRALARMAFRNERNLYQRKCDLTGKSIITSYGPQVSFPVYDYEAWHSDKWDPMQYGMDFDFNKTFFEQFAELYQKVPRINLLNQASENSDYCNYAYRNKNSYLLFGSHYNEDCLHSNYCWRCTSSLDNLNVSQSELAYEGFYSDNCYDCKFIEYCFNCNNCSFSYDLIGCKNCLFCSNLRNKAYHVFNKPVSREEFEKLTNDFHTKSHQQLDKAREKFAEIKLQAIHKENFQINTENCIGHNIQNSKNLYQGFNCQYAEDCRYICGGVGTHLNNCMDVSFIGYDPSELLYFCVNNTGNTDAVCCVSSWHSSEIRYCELCMDSHALFGCIGLHHKKFCILNKQYSKEEYEELYKKIVAHMKSTGEWGEFFPIEISQFPYNDSIAFNFFPKEKAQALEQNLKWKDPDKKEYRPSSYAVPENIEEVSEKISDEILACKKCGKNYKIAPLEFTLYKKLGIAIPTNCPDCRFSERVKLFNPPKLWPRTCDNCKKEILSTYSPNRKEIVYCNECYAQVIY